MNAHPAFTPLPLGSIRPHGWLNRQLHIQADGLTGHLDEFWPDVRDSAWIGGDGESWERGPYWLDGLVPLAYLLDDDRLKKKAEHWCTAIIAGQRDDGWIGPESRSGAGPPNRDPWPVFVALKALTQFAEATNNQGATDAVFKTLRSLLAETGKSPLSSWAMFRWQDLLLTIRWAYQRSPEKWLLHLAGIVRRQGYDWISHFSSLPFTERVPDWRFDAHVVNNAMGVKAGAVVSLFSGDRNEAATSVAAIAELDRYHGQASGVFSGDECLAGTMPSQGTELCAVVEYMLSLEIVAGITGEVSVADQLEKVAFNALPATLSPDMWYHQYDQQANQPQCIESAQNWFATNGPRANLFGLEPNFGCCLANMHQGWPKFVSHLWMEARDGIATIAYGPSEVDFSIGGTAVTLISDTDYPFDEMVTMTVKCPLPVEFALHLRIPAWARDASIAGTVAGKALKERPEPGRYHRIDRQWHNGDTITVRLPQTIWAQRRHNRSVTLGRGPIVLSLVIGEEWKKLDGEPPAADFEIYPTSPWNYGLAVDPDIPADHVTITANAVGARPFDPATPALEAMVRGRKVPEWRTEKGSSAPPPLSPVACEEPLESIRLVPYGATNLRITEFPLILEDLTALPWSPDHGA